MIGFQGDLIHMFNKNENAIHSSNYFNDLTQRDNIILMGDSMGDIKMAHGVPQPNNTLKIGFLNDKVSLSRSMTQYNAVRLSTIQYDPVQSSTTQLIH